MIGSMARCWGVRFAASCWGLGVLGGFYFSLSFCLRLMGLKRISVHLKDKSIDCSSEKYGRIMERMSSGPDGGWT